MTSPSHVASVAEIIKRIHDSVAEEAECNAGGGLGPTHIMLRHRDALALCTAISDGMPKWRDADHDPPADEQRVLACWKGSSCIEGMETLIYCADQDGSGDGWRDVHGDGRDPPTHWTLLEMPK